MTLLERLGEFGDKIQHLSGDLYRVAFSLIQLPPSGLEIAEARLQFGNPRYVQVNDEVKAKGLDHAKMKETRESIRTEGLKHPLTLRILDGDTGAFLQLVDGERRYRSIALLKEDKANCCDGGNKSMTEAGQLYEFIECRINEMSDIEALKVSFSLNDRAEGIGDYATLAVVRTLRDLNENDQEILRITGKSVSWLREADQLLSLDEKTFEAWKSEEINRKVALNLAKIQDANARLEKLEKVKEAVLERILKQKDILNDDIAKLDQREELAKAACVEANMLGGDVDGANEEVDKIQQIRTRKQHRRDTLRGQANGRDFDRAEGLDKPLTISKIKRFWLPELDDLIDNEEVNPNDVALVRKVLEKIISCEYSEDGQPCTLLEILRDHAVT